MAEELSFTERWLVGELLRLSQEASSFAVRSLGADIQKAGRPSIEEEFQLGSWLVELGTVMVAKATEHKANRTKPDMPTILSDRQRGEIRTDPWR